MKIVQHAKKIFLIGAPTGAGARLAGHERAPAALRAAGLVPRLEAAGFEVTDLGDCPPQLYQPDEENPRARNIGPVLAALNALRPRVEHAVKSGALALILGGDCTIALATLAGIRRYFHSVSLVYFDRDADLNVPGTTPSGCFDGMVISHIIGRGAPELVRFWGEPPLVREPDIALFGLERLDPPEQEFLEGSPIRRYTPAEISRQGPAVAAAAALERIHAGGKQYVLHLDVDAIAGEDFSATDLPAPGGLRLDAVREAFEMFVSHKNLAALEVTEYNPDRDPDGQGTQVLVDLLGSALAMRLRALTAAAATSAPAAQETASVGLGRGLATGAETIPTETAEMPVAGPAPGSADATYQQPQPASAEIAALTATEAQPTASEASAEESKDE